MQTDTANTLLNLCLAAFREAHGPREPSPYDLRAIEAILRKAELIYKTAPVPGEEQDDGA